jgi:hypothetical protein
MSTVDVDFVHKPSYQRVEPVPQLVPDEISIQLPVQELVK